MGVVAGLLGGFKVKGSGPFTIKDETIGGLALLLRGQTKER